MNPLPPSPGLYGVFGHPVAHSRSPYIHARFAELTGQHLSYGRYLCPLDGFAAELKAFRAQGGHGCNVTVPFKHEAFAGAHRHTPRALLAQAVNTLRFDVEGSGDQTTEVIWGDNTDGAGLVRDITVNAGLSLAGQRVLLIGAGGAAAGVLAPLLAERPALLQVVNRSAHKAHDLVARHTHWAEQHAAHLLAGGLDEAHSGFDVVINATASSLGGEAVPVSAGVLRPGALAVDMMYGGAAEPYLAWAREHGAVGRDGLGMLVEQAAEAFAQWRGVRPPSAQVLTELRRALQDKSPP